MTISNEPFEGGYRMVLADLFRHDPAAYGRAKAKVDFSISVCHAVGPLIGAWLASISISLPWAINTVACIATGAIAYWYLPESLPTAQRVPFRWKGSNPLSFVTLFRRGAKLRIYSMVHMCQYFLSGSGWEMPTHQYDQMHTQTLFNWSLMQRGRYNSVRSLCSLPASWVTGQLLRVIGPQSMLLLGQTTNMLESSLKSVAFRGWHFFALRPLGGINENTLRTAMAYTSSAIGSECGVAEGQLQSSLNNLAEICKIVRPVLWGPIYSRGMQRGWPGYFYAASAAFGLLQLGLMGWLAKAWAPRPVR